MVYTLRFIATRLRQNHYTCVVILFYYTSVVNVNLNFINKKYALTSDSEVNQSGLVQDVAIRYHICQIKL